ncbi:MAG: SDR family oxidoreductase [Kiritimatiellae bacterium]|nr:SDR family oxidoreductase [Kiritimatiellia bacterium]
MKNTGIKILITGGARRLGRILAETLATRGASTAIHYNSSSEEANDLKHQLAAHGTTAHLIQADLTSPATCEDVITQAVRLLGGLDVLINNAATFQSDTLRDLNVEHAQKQMMLNCWAPLLLARSFAQQCPGGKIIHILDQRIARHDGHHLSYTLSKKALAESVGMLALELAPNFTVNAVAPGAVLPPDKRSGTREKAGPAPMGHAGTPEEVAEAVAFLMEAESITGQIIYVDGGQHLL